METLAHCTNIQRSISPAKPSDEATEPTETAADDNSFSFQTDTVITSTMFEVEQKLHEETLLDEERIKEEAEKHWEETVQTQRYKALQHLLTRSKFYTDFLLQKMDQQQAEQQQINEKEAKLKKINRKKDEMKGTSEKDDKNKKKLRSKSGTLKNETKSDLLLPKKRRKRKNITDIQLSDYIDEKTLKENQTKLDYYDANEAVSSQEDKTDTFSRTINGIPVSDRQPSLVSGGVLRPYQLEGFEWLKVLYENGINGILADEMGLGKTIQCISLIAHLIEMGVPGPFLICAPLSTLPNWISEFKQFTPELPVILYHGSIMERNKLKSKISKNVHVEGLSRPIAPILLSSYEIIMKDKKTLQFYEWRYIIVDEGHRLKNLNCKFVRELKEYRSVNRLLLTGTPLQNNLSELWSLLNFLLPEIFGNLQIFESWFDFTAIGEQGGDEKIVAKEQEQQILTTLHQILTPFLLRRVKTDVEITIPPKKELLVYASLTSRQKEFYKAILDKTILNLTNQVEKKSEVINNEAGRPRRCSASAKVNYQKIFEDNDNLDEDFDFKLFTDYLGKPKASSNCTYDPHEAKGFEVNVKIQNVMMLLRKCCDHPYLLEYPLDPTGEYLIDENLVQSSGKLMLLDKLVMYLIKENHKILIFSQMTKMLDILVDYCFLRKLKYSRLDGKMKLETRQEEIKNFTENPEVYLFLLSTRAGGLGINLTAADTVIIYDSDWNPQCDLQAQDRCHRIGQTKPVVIYRFVTENTIDQKIIERASSKRKLEKMIIHHKKFKSGKKNVEASLSSINPEELLKLLKSSDHERVVRHGENETISDEDFKSLVDRSELFKENTSIANNLQNESIHQSRLFTVVINEI